MERFEWVSTRSQATLYPTLREAALATVELMQVPSHASVDLTGVPFGRYDRLELQRMNEGWYVTYVDRHTFYRFLCDHGTV